MSELKEIEKLFTHRKVAQIVLEATTPLKVGSGESDVEIDAPVLKNWNGLPMIQGTSLAGVLRAAFKDEDTKKHLFGKEFGSRALVSHAHLVDNEGKIPYGLGRGSSDAAFLNHYDDLAVREHTAINDKGVALNGSKFDEEVVYKGSRFKFELELITDNSLGDLKLWEELLSKLTSPLFRLGGGSTKGFGEMKIISCFQNRYELGKNYHLKPNNLNTISGIDRKSISKETALTYKIAIKPADFFSFGAGFGDDEVDAVVVKEKIVTWENNQGKFLDEMILMPASSLKGALSHRVAFHYNEIKKIFADQIEIDDFKNHIGSCNHAVATLFGAAKGHKNEQKGKALFSDVYKKDEKNVKIFDHVKIDRFTGGAVDSALYNEKVIAQRDVWNIKIVLSKDIDIDTREAFHATLDDLCRGWLPLGGMVNRGHGVFEGISKKDGGYDKIDDSHVDGWTREKGDNDAK